MMSLEVWEVKQLTQSYQLERELECKTSSFGSKSLTLFLMAYCSQLSLRHRAGGPQVPLWLLFLALSSSLHVSQDTLSLTVCQWFRYTRIGQVAHKGKRLCCCRRLIMLLLPSLFATNFASTSLNLNQPTTLSLILQNLKIHVVHTHKIHMILETLSYSEEFLKVSPSTATVRKEKLANIHNSTNIW